MLELNCKQGDFALAKLHFYCLVVLNLAELSQALAELSQALAELS